MAKISKDLARRTLERSALGIGERHDADDGRRFTCELLNEPRRVRALFLEAKGRASLPAIRQANAVKQQGGTPTSIATEALGIIAPEYGGAKVRIGHVAAVAIWRSIPVYCIDVHASDYAEESLKDYMPKAVQVRDKVAAYLFKKIVERFLGGDKTGCLVLYGASHFTGTNTWAKQDCLADYLELDYVLFE